MAVVQYTITHNSQNNTINLGRVRAVPRLCELYPGICLTTEEKARKNLSQGRRNVKIIVAHINTSKKMYSVSKRDTVELRHKKGEEIEHL